MGQYFHVQCKTCKEKCQYERKSPFDEVKAYWEHRYLLKQYLDADFTYLNFGIDEFASSTAEFVATHCDCELFLVGDEGDELILTVL